MKLHLWQAIAASIFGPYKQDILTVLQEDRPMSVMDIQGALLKKKIRLPLGVISAILGELEVVKAVVRFDLHGEKETRHLYFKALSKEGKR